MWFPVLRRLFKAQQKETLENLERVSGKILGCYAGWSRRKVAEAITKDSRVDSIIPDMSKWDLVFIEEGGKLIEDIYGTAGAEAAALVGVRFDQSNPRVAGFIRSRSEAFAADVNATTAKKIRKTLSHGYLNGETIDELSARVRVVFTEATGPRSEAIARTETIASSNAGAMEGYTQAGVRKKSWLSARDGSARDSHLAADEKYSNKPIMMGQQFSLTDPLAAGQSPGNTGVAAHDINCRCTLLPEIEEDE